MRSLAEEKNKAAKRVLKLIEVPDKMLSAVLICNNIVNLSASSLSTAYAFDICTRIDISFWRDHAKEPGNKECREAFSGLFQCDTFSDKNAYTRDLYRE